MRLYGFAASAILASSLMSGCSWLGGFGQSGSNHGAYGAAGHHQGARFGARKVDPCQVPHAQAPIPQGCHPSQVSIGTGQYGGASQYGTTGFAQTPQFGAPKQAQYADSGYGSHAGGNVHTARHHGGSAPKARKPRFRGSLDIGVEKSMSGDLLDYDRSGAPDPTANFNAYRFRQGSQSGVTVAGDLTTTTFYADNRANSALRGDRAGNYLGVGPTFAELPTFDTVSSPTISIGDAWSTPATFGVGGEFIMNDRATVFGRVGYTTAEGNSGDVASVEGTVYRRTETQSFDDTGAPIGRPVPNTTFVPNTQLASWAYDFSDMSRLDLEAGGRYYLNPVAGQSTGRTVTPFVSASAGASRYNAVSYTVAQNQLSYASVFDGGTPNYYQVTGNPNAPDPNNRVELYDSQWVPSGRLTAGVEWQVTPKTAFALESGVRLEGARDYANGNSGHANVSVPVTLRGSFNF